MLRTTKTTTIHDLPTLAEQKSAPAATQPFHKPDADLNSRISVWRGDITTLNIDAIVNAANEWLGGCGMPGHCIDAAICLAAGPQLIRACKPFGGCKPGDAVITEGFKLPARYVLHTVGPRVQVFPADAVLPDPQNCFKSEDDEGRTCLVRESPDVLASCYIRCLDIMKTHKADPPIRSVAFCCISTGVFGYRKEPAAHVALNTVRQWLEKGDNRKYIDRIIFNVFTAEDAAIYARLAPLYFPPATSASASSTAAMDVDDDALAVNGRWLGGNYLVAAITGRLLAYHLETKSASAVELPDHSATHLLDLQTLRAPTTLSALQIDEKSCVSDFRGFVFAFTSSKEHILRFDHTGKVTGRVAFVAFGSGTFGERTWLFTDDNGAVFVCKLPQKYTKKDNGGQIWRCEFDTPSASASAASAAPAASAEVKTGTLREWCVLPIVDKERYRNWICDGVKGGGLIFYDRWPHGDDNYRDWITAVIMVSLDEPNSVRTVGGEFGAHTGEHLTLMAWQGRLMQLRGSRGRFLNTAEYFNVGAPSGAEYAVSASVVSVNKAQEVFIWWRMPKGYALCRHAFSKKVVDDSISPPGSLVFEVADTEERKTSSSLRLSHSLIAAKLPQKQILSVYQPQLLLPTLADALPKLIKPLVEIVREYLMINTPAAKLRYNRLLVVSKNTPPNKPDHLDSVDYD